MSCWPSDTILRHWCWLGLGKETVCCVAISIYPTQYWIITHKVPGNSSHGPFYRYGLNLISAKDTHSRKAWDKISFPFPKLQRRHRWSLGMYKLFHPTYQNGWIWLSMVEWKLIHVSNRSMRKCDFYIISRNESSYVTYSRAQWVDNTQETV